MKYYSCLLFLFLTGIVSALEVHPIFGDNMVLQRNQPVAIWGKAAPGSTVTVSAGDRKAAGKADAGGKWSVVLPEFPEPGGPYTLSVTGNGETVTFNNVMAGDVYLCAGQSNMEWLLRNSTNGAGEIAVSDYPDIRLFRAQRTAVYERTGELHPKPWRPCSPTTSGWFSAVAYYFGKELYRELNVPVGLIDASWGGVLISAYLPLETLATDPDFLPILERYERARFHMTPEKTAAYAAELKQWELDRISDPGLKKPEAPWGKSQYHPGTLYNGMIDPIAPFGLAGIIWYQGEANAPRAHQYRKLLPLLIQSWRARWNREDLPFVIVQLPNYRKGPNSPLPPEPCWAELREAQSLTVASVPHTAMAVTVDLGEAEDIHPRDKREVGRRLALAALDRIYRKDIVSQGPVLIKAEFVTGKAVLEFDQMPTGNGDSLNNFEIAGSDRVFHPAAARIFEGKVTVSSPAVESPVAVRYCWKNNPENINFYNKEGLPAMPFRTDGWPGVTEGRL